MAADDDETGEGYKVPPDVVGALKQQAMNTTESKFKHKMLEQLRENLILQVIMLGENIPNPPAGGDQLRANAHHATALSGYLDAVMKLDAIIKTMAARP